MYSLKTRSCAVQIFKSLLRAINENVENKADKSKLLDQVLPVFIEKLIGSLNAPSGENSSFELKTEIMKGKLKLSFCPKQLTRIIFAFSLQFQCSPTWSTTCPNSFINTMRKFCRQFGSY